MNTPATLRDIPMCRNDFMALSDAIDHHRRSLAALKARRPGDSAARISVDAAARTTTDTLKLLVAIQHSARVK